MEVCAPTNFDDALIPRLAELGVAEVYGKLTADEAGGGRSSHLLPDVDADELADHVKLAHRHGMRFNYLLNAVTTDARETTRPGHRALRELLGRVADAGVDGVTVANPLILRMVRRFHPTLQVKVSAFAGVSTPQQAAQWSDLGADVLTPLPTAVNREFGVLRAMARSFTGSLQLVANNNCLQGCAHYPVHAALHAATSRRGHWSRGYLIDYCVFGCRLQRLTDPASYVKGDWIRPEDLPVYAEVGIDQIKIVNRSSPTDVIVRRAAAYRQGRFDGNLFELVEQALDHRRLESLDASEAWRMLRTFVRPRLVDPRSLRHLAELAFAGSPVVELPNTSLDGFIEPFLERSCLVTDCRDCEYCDRVAEEHLRVDGQRYETFRRRYRSTLDALVDGSLFERGWKPVC